jgi:hypothetical protein
MNTNASVQEKNWILLSMRINVPRGTILKSYQIIIQWKT